MFCFIGDENVLMTTAGCIIMNIQKPTTPKLAQFSVAKPFIQEDKEKLLKFENICRKHKPFFKKSIVFDAYLIAIAYEILIRSNAILNDTSLFCALYLASSFEEDSPEGLDEISNYCIGIHIDMQDSDYVSISPKVVFLDADEFALETLNFQNRVAKLFVGTNFNVLVSQERCSEILNAFSLNNFFLRTRKERDMDLFAPF